MRELVYTLDETGVAHIYPDCDRAIGERDEIALGDLTTEMKREGVALCPVCTTNAGRALVHQQL